MSKSKRQRVIEESRSDIEGVLERLSEIAAIAQMEPYLTDATAMLTQGVAFLEKQLVSEFDWKPPEIKPESVSRKPTDETTDNNRPKPERMEAKAK